MIYTYRKTILIMLAAILVITGCIFGVYQYQMAHRIIPTPVAKQEKAKVAIKNIDTVPLSLEAKNAITHDAAEALQNRYGVASYTIVLREQSYRHDVAPDNTATTTILLDIPEKKITYLYTQIKSGVDSAYDTLYLRCAPEDQQLVHPSVCQDSVSD